MTVYLKGIRFFVVVNGEHSVTLLFTIGEQSLYILTRLFTNMNKIQLKWFP